jgi:hypothetical protein
MVAFCQIFWFSSALLEISCVGFESHRDFENVLQRGVDFAAFQVTDIGPMETREFL